MKALFIALCIICIIVPMVVYTCGIIKTINADVNCISYLELAADANSVDLAEKHLTTAINYLETNNLTSGHTGVIIKNPKITGYYPKQQDRPVISQRKAVPDIKSENRSKPEYICRNEIACRRSRQSR